MAIVADSLLSTFSRTGFVKPPDSVRQTTAMPRAMVNYNILNGTISAKPATDQQELTVSLVFQTEFAYRFLELYAHLNQDVANDWSPRAYLEVTNAIRNIEGGATQRHPFVLEDVIVPGGSEAWIARVAAEANTPRYIFQTKPGTQVAPIVVFRANNQNTAAGAVGSVNFYCSFLEYDIEQVERFPLHWPLSTWAR